MDIHTYKDEVWPIVEWLFNKYEIEEPVEPAAELILSAYCAGFLRGAKAGQLNNQAVIELTRTMLSKELLNVVEPPHEGN